MGYIIYKTFKEVSYLSKQDIKTLESILLDIGGKTAKIDKNEPDFYNLLTRGILLDKPSDIMKVGEMCQCHKNSVFLWEQNKRKYRIMTGYALSNSGIWHQHTWLIDKFDNIIETTVKREKYYGYIMDRLESECFLCEYKDKEI